MARPTYRAFNWTGSPRLCGLALAVICGMLPPNDPAFAQDTPVAAPVLAAPPASSQPALAASPQTMATAPDSGVSPPPRARPAGRGPIIDKAAKAPEHDLSPLGMFLAADPVVKGVMILLMASSVVTWTVLLVKSITIRVARRRMRRAIELLRNAKNLSEAGSCLPRGGAAILLRHASEEARLSQGLSTDGIKERVQLALYQAEGNLFRSLATGIAVLATIGSTGPFVGLFGTVWGIMRSFIGIANSNTTNLAVVAPGIAEALLATGMGLVAAIPAVVIYNAMLRSIGSYRALSNEAVTLILRHLSRELDQAQCALPEKLNYPHMRLAVAE